MKNKKILITGLVLVVAVVVGFWLLHYFSDKEVIRREFLSIAQELTKEGEETPVNIALKMRPVKDFLAPVCEVFVVERDYREKLEAGLAVHYIIMYRSRCTTLHVSLEEISIDIPAKGQAEVRVLVHIQVNRDHSDVLDQAHWAEFSLSKVEKRWRVHRAILPESLVETYSTL